MIQSGNERLCQSETAIPNESNSEYKCTGGAESLSPDAPIDPMTPCKVKVHTSLSTLMKVQRQWTFHTVDLETRMKHSVITTREMITLRPIGRRELSFSQSLLGVMLSQSVHSVLHTKLL